MIDRKQRNIALLVAGCLFMENLDGTIVTTSAPRIGASLHVTAAAVGLVITAYLITLGVLIPMGGWMVKNFGSKTVFLSAIAIFTISSLLCATSTSLPMLVAMRVLQGVGGAMMTPVGRIVAMRGIEKQDLLRIISFIVWPALIAPVIAPLAGGIITTYTSWRFLFLINLPLGVIAFTVAIRIMPSTQAAAFETLDWVGVCLTSVGLGSLIYAGAMFSQPGSTAIPAALAIGSVLFIALAIHHLLRTPTPLVDLRTYAIRTFREGQSGIVLYFIVLNSVPFLLPLLFETVFNWSPIKSGVIVIFVYIGNAAIKPATTFLITRFGFRSVLIGATSGVALSMFAIGELRVSTPIPLIAAVVMFNGVARSVGFTAYMSLTLADVPEGEMQNANVLAATIQQLGAGLAIVAGTLSLRVGNEILNAFTSHGAARSAFAIAFSLLGVIALIDTAKAVRLPRDAGSSVSRAVVASVPASDGPPSAVTWLAGDGAMSAPRPPDIEPGQHQGPAFDQGATNYQNIGSHNGECIPPKVTEGDAREM